MISSYRQKSRRDNQWGSLSSPISNTRRKWKNCVPKWVVSPQKWSNRCPRFVAVALKERRKWTWCKPRRRNRDNWSSRLWFTKRTSNWRSSKTIMSSWGKRTSRCTRGSYRSRTSWSLRRRLRSRTALKSKNSEAVTKHWIKQRQTWRNKLHGYKRKMKSEKPNTTKSCWTLTTSSK